MNIRCGWYTPDKDNMLKGLAKGGTVNFNAPGTGGYVTGG
jgi:hypothetical protein